ncbi:unnamed protein product, partial [Rotaria sordida]
AYYGPDTDENGQQWIGGWIQMKIFAQQCKNCDEYVTGELDDQKCQNMIPIILSDEGGAQASMTAINARSVVNAVQAKFGLIADELAVVWTPMLECIKSKRRNMKAKILKDMKKSDVNNSTSDVRNQPTESILSMQQNVDISDTETNEQF